MKKILSIITLTMFIIAFLPISAFVEAAVYTAPPSVSVSSPSQGIVKQGGSVSYTVTFENAETIDLKTTDIGIAGAGVTVTKSVTGTGNVRTVTLSNVQGPVGQLVSIALRAGVATNSVGGSLQTPKTIAFAIDAGTISSNVVDNTPVVDNNQVVTTYVDNARPSISIAAPSLLYVNNGDTITYTVSYTDNVGLQSLTLKASDITLHGFNANVSVSQTGYQRTVTLSNIQGAVGYPKYISIAAGTAVDAAGNYALGIIGSAAFTIKENATPATDTTKPTMTVYGPNPTELYAGETVKYAVVYSDNVGLSNISLNTSDITLNGFTADVKITGTGYQRIITLSNVQGTVGGSKNISIAAGTATDAAGNKALGIASTESFSIKAKSTDNTNNNTNTNGNNSTQKPGDWVANPNTGI
jgi:ribosomal protein L6P/L9E